jgi:peroxin-6
MPLVDHTNDAVTSNTPELHHVAVSPKGPAGSVDDTNWTIVPVRPSSALANCTIQFSPSSLALQAFAEELQRIAPSKLMSHSRSGIDVCVLDVLPLPLETVFVTLENDLAKRLEDGEGTFHVEHSQTNGYQSKGKAAANPEDRLTSAIREALSSLKVVHTGDFFALPLPPHPITHVPPAPAKVTLCEPVAQGTLFPSTRIIVTRSRHHSQNTRKTQCIPLNRALQQVIEGDEDTANEQFYSAAEDRYKTDAAIDDGSSLTETETEISTIELDDLSDDSMEDIISLQAPILPVTNASGVSTIQPGTPHAAGLGRRANGINTPGSVFSTFTATTALGGGQRGRLFKAQGLMRPLPEELLRPPPSTDDDEEARVYVDVNSLTKIGCFSGDWVRLETASEPPPAGMGLWGLGSFGNGDEEEFMWRPARVYSLPEGYSHRTVTKIPNSRNPEGRRLSFFESQVSKPASPTVYLSPILLANLDGPAYLRLSSLKRTPHFATVSQLKPLGPLQPPTAREVTLLRIASPLSTDRTLQTAFFTGLKRHFASRMRVVKTGDLIGIPIDETLGRTLFQPSSTKEDPATDDAIAILESEEGQFTKNTGVVWFKAGHITPARSEGNESSDDGDIWGGVASIDASSTQMVMAGIEKSRVPATMDNSWEYYLRLREISKSSAELHTSNLPAPRTQHITALRRRLRELIAAATSPQAIHLDLQPLAILLVSTQRNIGKAEIANRACADIGLHTFTIEAYDMLNEGGSGGSDVKSEALLKARAERAMSCGPEFCALLIRHVEALTADRMITALEDLLANARVLIATTTEVDKVPDGVRALFTHELEMTAPDEWEREGILRSIVDEQGAALAPDVNLSGVAVKTAALVAGDLVDVVERAIVARRTRLEDLAAHSTTAEAMITTRDVQVAGGPSGRCLTKVDFDLAVDAARKNFADAIGAPKIPNVSWDDVGGLTNVKDAVMETIQLPLERPELFAKGMKKRSGILFYGPPGTGKTLLAKAIATEFSLNFFSVKGPELLNMYIGESEANVRRVFQRARDARPCVVFFDELDSVAPKRGNQGDSGGVMDRIVSQLLAELDGMSDGDDGSGGVFVIGATNRPDLLDAALLRPGRFDKMLYLGVSDTHAKQTTIMEALTRKYVTSWSLYLTMLITFRFTMSPTLSLRRIAEKLPFTYTGADFYALCSDAMLKAVTRQASAVDAKIAAINASREYPISTAYFFDHYATKEDVAVLVTEEDFMAARRELIPSVSTKELEHYKRVREQFEAVDEKNAEQEDVGGNGTVLQPSTPEWHAAHKPKPNGRVRIKGKGKGKAREGVDGEDEESFYGEAPDDSGMAIAMNGSAMPYRARGNGFQDGNANDDEDLY